MNEIPSKSEMVKMLQSNVVRVVFTKKDGSKRIMRCTLHPDAYADYTFAEKSIDAEGNPVINRPNDNPNQVKVWEITGETITSGQWRSFMLPTLIAAECSIEQVLYEEKA